MPLHFRSHAVHGHETLSVEEQAQPCRGDWGYLRLRVRPKFAAALTARSVTNDATQSSRKLSRPPGVALRLLNPVVIALCRRVCSPRWRSSTREQEARNTLGKFEILSTASRAESGRGESAHFHSTSDVRHVLSLCARSGGCVSLGVAAFAAPCNLTRKAQGDNNMALQCTSGPTLAQSVLRWRVRSERACRRPATTWVSAASGWKG